MNSEEQASNDQVFLLKEALISANDFYAEYNKDITFVTMASPLREKSYSFALKVVECVKFLQSNREFVLSKQLLRSGTSIGALIREAQFGQSRADFVNKLSIDLKEANETYYWLSLLKDTGHLRCYDESSNIYSSCNELISMLVASVKTAKSGTGPSPY